MLTNKSSIPKTDFDKVKFEFHNFLTDPANEERLHGFGNQLTPLEGGDAARKTWEAFHKPELLPSITFYRFKNLFEAINKGYVHHNIKPKLENKIKLQEFDKFKIDESFRKGEIYFSEMLNFKDIWEILNSWQLEQEEQIIKFKVKLEESLKKDTDDLNKFYIGMRSNQSLTKKVEPEILGEFEEEIKIIYKKFDEFFNVENVRVRTVQGQSLVNKQFSDLLLEVKDLEKSINTLFKKGIKVYIGQDKVYNHCMVLDNKINSFADITISMQHFWGLQIRKDNKLEPIYYNYHDNENNEEKIIQKTLDRINFLKSTNK